MSGSKRVISVICVLFMLLGGKISAQSNHYGIGVNAVDFLANYDLYDALEMEIFDLVEYPVLYGAIVLPSLRIDPEFSYWRYAHNVDDNRNNRSSSEKSAILHLGIGISPIIQKSSKIATYAGIKTGINFVSTKSESSGQIETGSESKSTKTNFYIGPCLGTEYLFTDNLSLGGEFQFLYTVVGEGKTTFNGEESDDDRDISDSIIKSKALIYLRWYF